MLQSSPTVASNSSPGPDSGEGGVGGSSSSNGENAGTVAAAVVVCLLVFGAAVSVIVIVTAVLLVRRKRAKEEVRTDKRSGRNHQSTRSSRSTLHFINDLYAGKTVWVCMCVASAIMICIF